MARKPTAHEQREIENGKRWRFFNRARGEDVQEIQVIGRGRGCYLWMGDIEGGFIASVSGRRALERLRDALIAALGEVETDHGE